MPSTSYTNSSGETKYRDTFHPITKGSREALTQAVLDKYDEALSQSQDEGIEIDVEQVIKESFVAKHIIGPATITIGAQKTVKPSPY